MLTGKLQRLSLAGQKWAPAPKRRPPPCQEQSPASGNGTTYTWARLRWWCCRPRPTLFKSAGRYCVQWRGQVFSRHRSLALAQLVRHVLDETQSVKMPLIDLCFYTEEALKEWLDHNPFMRHTTQLLDVEGYHVLFRCPDAPPAQGRVSFGGDEPVGYLVKASPEMVARCEKLERKLRDRPGQN